MKKIIKIFIWIIIITLLLALIFVPSYLSVRASCGENGEEFLEDLGLMIGGQVIIENITETSEDIQIIIINDKPRILRHETVHVVQYKRGFPSLSCSHPVQKYLSEIEAYIFQWLPDKIFYWMYRI